MKGKLTILKFDGSVVEEELTAQPSLKQLQAAIGGGYIEGVPLFASFKGEECVTFCDEEGKMNGLPINVAATNLWAEQVPELDDVLVGDVVIVTGDEELLEEL